MYDERKKPTGERRIYRVNLEKKYLIGEGLDIWFDKYANRLKESTIKTYRYVRKRALKAYPVIEQIELDDLQAIEFQQILDGLVNDFNLSKSSVRQVRCLYLKMYRYANKYKLCLTNPIRDTDVIASAREKKVQGLSLDSQKMVERIVEHLPFWRRSAVLFLLHTGLRRSELINLKWADWLVDEEFIIVQKSKTNKGVRAVPLSNYTSFLLSLVKHVNYRKNNEYIFCDPAGHPLTAGKLQYKFKLIKQSSYLEDIGPHILRHTFASRMVEKGINIKVLADIMGHEDPKFTIKTYVNLDRDYLKTEFKRCTSD